MAPRPLHLLPGHRPGESICQSPRRRPAQPCKTPRLLPRPFAAVGPAPPRRPAPPRPSVPPIHGAPPPPPRPCRPPPRPLCGGPRPVYPRCMVGPSHRTTRPPDSPMAVRSERGGASMRPTSASSAPLASPEYYVRLGRLQHGLRDRYGLPGTGAGSGPSRGLAGALTPVPCHSPGCVFRGPGPPATPPPPKFLMGPGGQSLPNTVPHCLYWRFPPEDAAASLHLPRSESGSSPACHSQSRLVNFSIFSSTRLLPCLSSNCHPTLTAALHQ